VILSARPDVGAVLVTDRGGNLKYSLPDAKVRHEFHELTQIKAPSGRKILTQGLSAANTLGMRDLSSKMR